MPLLIVGITAEISRLECDLSSLRTEAVVR